MGAGPSVCGNTNTCACYNVKEATLPQSSPNENVKFLSMRTTQEDLAEEELFATEEVSTRDINGKLEIVEEQKQDTDAIEEVGTHTSAKKEDKPDKELIGLLSPGEGCEVTAADVDTAEAESDRSDAQESDEKTDDVTTVDEKLSDGSEKPANAAGQTVDNTPVGTQDIEKSEETTDAMDSKENLEREKPCESESDNETDIFEPAETEPLNETGVRKSTEISSAAKDNLTESPNATDGRNENPETSQLPVVNVKKSRSTSTFFSFFRKKKNNAHSTADDLIVIGTKIEPPADYEPDESFVDAVLSVEEVRVAEIKSTERKGEDGAGDDDTVTAHQADKVEGKEKAESSVEENHDKTSGDGASEGNSEKVFGGLRGAVRSPTKWMANWMWG
ncbi:protein starmaker-like [Ptychodera flava]|uniref:protein starmaker-like n=1 Tax=Ptychodera flava TaxID=63121 RepID=UPI00396A0F3C